MVQNGMAMNSRIYDDVVDVTGQDQPSTIKKKLWKNDEWVDTKFIKIYNKYELKMEDWCKTRSDEHLVLLIIFEHCLLILILGEDPASSYLP